MSLSLALFLAVFFLNISNSQATETWECESDNNRLPQLLTIEVENNKLISFEYTSLAPSADGDTKYSCYIAAKRNSKESSWSDDKESININLLDSAKPEDTVQVTHTKNTFKFEFDLSPSNCGHSTPLASAIAITKGKKTCHSIEMNY